MKPSAICSGLSGTPSAAARSARDGLQASSRCVASSGSSPSAPNTAGKNAGCSLPSMTLQSVTVSGPPAVARRAGIGAGRVRSHAQAAIEEAADRATAGGDRVDAQHRRTQAHAADGRLQATARAATEMRDVGRGAAHVEGDDLLEASRGGGAHRADDAAGGAGEDGVLAVQQAALGEPAAGLHELQAHARKRLGDALQVAAQHGGEIGVGDRRLAAARRA